MMTSSRLHPGARIGRSAAERVMEAFGVQSKYVIL